MIHFVEAAGGPTVGDAALGLYCLESHGTWGRCAEWEEDVLVKKASWLSSSRERERERERWFGRTPLSLRARFGRGGMQSIATGGAWLCSCPRGRRCGGLMPERRRCRWTDA
jgi:hypothetical protein